MHHPHALGKGSPPSVKHLYSARRSFSSPCPPERPIKVSGMIVIHGDVVAPLSRLRDTEIEAEEYCLGMSPSYYPLPATCTDAVFVVQY